MIVSSYSIRIVAPFQLGLQNMVHDTLEIAWRSYGRLGAIVAGEHRLADAEVFDVIAPQVRHSSWSLEEETECHTLHLFASQLRRLPASGTYPLEGRIGEILRSFPAPTAPRADVERAARALAVELERLGPPIEPNLDERLLRVIGSLASARSDHDRTPGARRPVGPRPGSDHDRTPGARDPITTAPRVLADRSGRARIRSRPHPGCSPTGRAAPGGEVAAAGGSPPPPPFLACKYARSHDAVFGSGCDEPARHDGCALPIARDGLHGGAPHRAACAPISA